MTKVTIFSGFLGAGKTTLIKKLLTSCWQGEKLVLIENEFGEIGIDGGFLKDAGIKVNEMNSGCICCSLVGDFGKALTEVLNTYAPDRILIEPSGVGKLSDVVRAVEQVGDDRLHIDGLVTVADATKCRLYSKNFGEFFNDQIASAATVMLSRTDNITDEKLQTAIEVVRAQNPKATIVTTPWDALTGEQLAQAMSKDKAFEQELLEACHEHHHHHHDDDCDCGCHEHHHHHHHDDDCDCGCHDHEHHHHHHHDDDCDCGCHEHEHHHHHHHDDDCDCGCHDHEHHHHHHADEVFGSFGRETARRYTTDEIKHILTALDSGDYGQVLRAKGILPAADGSWIHFDYVPAEHNVRAGGADYTGRLCVIGAHLDEAALEKLFGL